ncbi:MAG: DUF1049 domain-containing protein [Aquincola sp.]|nr:DUF1049 domain-containing protein [Aquincola sp.]
MIFISVNVLCILLISVINLEKLRSSHSMRRCVMKGLFWLGAAVAAALMGWLVAANWTVLASATALNFGFVSLQAPLGLLLLAIMVTLALAMAALSAAQRVASRRENRDLIDEVRRLQALADQAEGSRMENLQRQISTEFRLLTDCLQALGSRLEAEASDPSAEPSRLPLVKLGP